MRCISLHGHAGHFGVIAHAERVVKSIEHRDQPGKECQLDDFRVAEILAEPDKEIVSDSVGVARDLLGVFDCQPLANRNVGCRRSARRRCRATA